MNSVVIYSPKPKYVVRGDCSARLITTMMTRSLQAQMNSVVISSLKPQYVRGDCSARIITTMMTRSLQAQMNSVVIYSPKPKYVVRGDCSARIITTTNLPVITNCLTNIMTPKDGQVTMKWRTTFTTKKLGSVGPPTGRPVTLGIGPVGPVTLTPQNWAGFNLNSRVLISATENERS